MRCRIAELLVVVALALVLTRETAAAATIDASTIRVFAVGTVSTENIDAPNNVTVAVARANSGHGTGFVVDEGLILTAQHVVEDARHVVVRLPGEAGFFPARVVYADKAKDIAILTVNGKLPVALALNGEPPRVRSTVFAVGYPIDATRKQPQSARGIIAGFLDDGTVQLDMALNPGNSGGPIVDEQDAVVGMAIARGDLEQGVQGIGYAVPVQMLQAALVEAKRRLATGEATAATGMAHDSAMVVDELVQHGALYELRKVTDLGSATNVDLDKALAALTARIHDADLLVFVASAMWNVSIALAYADPTKLELTSAQASSLSSRLRDSASAAVRRAVELDGSVARRSSFVGLVTAGNDGVTTAPGVTGTSVPTTGSGPTPVIVLQGAPMIRHNTKTGSTGVGFGGSLAVAWGDAGQRVLPWAGLGIGHVSVSNTDGEFSHLLVAAQAGLLARIDKVELSAALEAYYYSISIESAIMAPTAGSAYDLAMGVRFGVGYHILPKIEIGAAARILSGPTLWIEPVFAALSF